MDGALLGPLPITLFHGTINMNTLDKAIKSVKANPRRNRDTLLSALEPAKWLHKGICWTAAVIQASLTLVLLRNFPCWLRRGS
jgi:hypothetical protein